MRLICKSCKKIYRLKQTFDEEKLAKLRCKLCGSSLWVIKASSGDIHGVAKYHSSSGMNSTQVSKKTRYPSSEDPENRIFRAASVFLIWVKSKNESSFLKNLEQKGVKLFKKIGKHQEFEGISNKRRLFQEALQFIQKEIIQDQGIGDENILRYLNANLQGLSKEQLQRFFNIISVFIYQDKLISTRGLEALQVFAKHMGIDRKSVDKMVKKYEKSHYKWKNLVHLRQFKIPKGDLLKWACVAGFLFLITIVGVGYYKINIIKDFFDSPPNATILKPQFGRINFLSGKSIEFSAFCTDSEDGMIDDDSIVWESNISGHIGRGDYLLSDLPPGAHEITLTAYDSKGHKDIEVINIHVSAQVSNAIQASCKMDDNPISNEELHLIYRTSRNYECKNLTGLDLSEMQLQNSNFRGALLENTDFSHADLSQADFVHAYLRNANLSHANLSGVKIESADLKYANFSHAILSNVEFNYTELKNVNLSYTDLRGCNLSHLDLSSLVLEGVNLRGVSLINTKLSGVNLSSADLSHSNLTGADLRGAILKNADLSHATLKKTLLESANLKSVNFTNAIFLDNNFRNADLSDATLLQVDLNNSRFTGANLSGADLLRSKFWGAKMNSCNLENAKMVNIDLRNVDFSYSNCKKTNFQMSDLRGANFRGTDLFEANFTNANLIHVENIEKAKNIDTVSGIN